MNTVIASATKQSFGLMKKYMNSVITNVMKQSFGLMKKFMNGVIANVINWSLKSFASIIQIASLCSQ